MTISNECVAAIKAGLERVSEGPWTAYIDSCAKCEATGEVEADITGLPGGYHARFASLADAAHIARMDPATVSALIERMEKAEAARDEAIKLMSEASREAGEWKGKYETAGYGVIDGWIERAARSEIERDVAVARMKALEAELAGQRMCVNCGKFARLDHPREDALPECIGPEGYAACTFDLTPQEAWQHWSKIAHAQRERTTKAEAERDSASALAGRLLEHRQKLERALTWYDENTRLARLIHSEGDRGRNNLAEDGGSRARAALEGK